MPPLHSLDAAAEKTAMRLLVVDDDDVDRERICRVLAKSCVACTVTESATLGDARALLAANDFDCIFLDYHIGGSTGTELLHEIKDSSRSYVPVIIITGSDNERLVVQTMQSGAYDFISKMQLQVGLIDSILINSQQRLRLERELKTERERLEYLSFYDTLTGLPNRALFFDRAEQTLQSASRRGQTFAIMQIDLDLFKNVNDSFGHWAGDMVLATVGERIQAILRGADTVARFGGDEFAIVLSEASPPEVALHVAEKITEAVRKPISIGEHLVIIESSIGIALYPSQGDCLQTLLLKADWAMYAAKNSANLCLIYAEGMDSMRQLPAPESDRLRLAIERQELFVEYQPIMDLSTYAVDGFEALVRWRTPEGEIVPPGVFIPLAERSPLIRPLTYWVLGAVLDQALLWCSQGLMLTVSVNISARMLDDTTLAQCVLRELEVRGLPTHLLTLELTETALMSNVERAKKTLDELIGAGVRISIDDFGAGFTSFKYLRQLDVSEIKVDMAFTAELKEGSRDSVIVRSIAQLANGFAIAAVAEGIENLDDAAKLLALGCHKGQGYGIARPMLGKLVAEWLTAWNDNKALLRK
ncbi:MAG: EAL domain-containing protein [Pseudomonas sp.]|uniref:EAL domain-containing response regulator n=1 Tax=Pseudomonas sp. TaxID=306 RepID=UPI003982AEC7